MTFARDDAVAHAEVRRKPEGREQRSEVRGRRVETQDSGLRGVGRGKAEDRSQRAEEFTVYSLRFTVGNSRRKAVGRD